ncbi:MAG TPA: hypothetical protein VNO43_17675, partial [Candidatus Eisenbacteria bacterium]|nr:hypothetical protein [Candidatus Eisenbacteria bacterium]
MHERLIEFAHALRRNGLRVSLSEDLDALRAVESVGVEDPTLFRSALRAALVKRAADREAFEELFDYFFFGIGSAVERADEQLMAGLGLSPS